MTRQPPTGESRFRHSASRGITGALLLATLAVSAEHLPAAAGAQESLWRPEGGLPIDFRGPVAKAAAEVVVDTDAFARWICAGTAGAHPKRLTLPQVVATDTFATGDELGLLILYGPDDLGANPRGRITATAYRIQAPGVRKKLGTVKAKQSKSSETAAGSATVPGSVAAGESLEWEIRFSRFKTLGAGECFALAAGIGAFSADPSTRLARLVGAVGTDSTGLSHRSRLGSNEQLFPQRNQRTSPRAPAKVSVGTDTLVQTLCAGTAGTHPKRLKLPQIVTSDSFVAPDKLRLLIRYITDEGGEDPRGRIRGTSYRTPESGGRKKIATVKTLQTAAGAALGETIVNESLADGESLGTVRLRHRDAGRHAGARGSRRHREVRGGLPS